MLSSGGGSPMDWCYWLRYKQFILFVLYKHPIDTFLCQTLKNQLNVSQQVTFFRSEMGLPYVFVPMDFEPQNESI